MLLDGPGRLSDIHLLDDVDQATFLAQGAAAIGTAVEGVFGKEGDLIAWEEGTSMPGVSRLSTGRTRPVILAEWGPGGLNDVRGRGLGGGRGILARRGQLLLKAGNRGAQRFDFDALGVELRLEALALGTGGGVCYCHAPVLLPLCLSVSAPVNGYFRGSVRAVVEELRAALKLDKRSLHKLGELSKVDPGQLS